MSQKIHLTPQEVPDNLKVIFDVLEIPGEKYRTTKFAFEITDTVQLINTNWSGGTKNDYIAVNLQTGESKPMIDRRPWPQNQGPLPPAKMPPDWAIAKRSTFRGKNMGVTFYIHPDNAPRTLPSPEEEGSGLDKDQQIVLIATRSRKPSYGGISNYRYHEANRITGITPERWNAAKEALIASGHLNKRGAITPKGRNEIGSMDFYHLKESKKTFTQFVKLAESLPIDGPPGTKMKKHGDGLTKAKALEMAKKLRAQGIFGTVFPSDAVPGKRMVISWER